MNKIKTILFAAITAALILLTMCAPLAAAEAALVPSSQVEPTPTEPFSWEYLATIAGAAAATLLIVQFIKAPLDAVWKIPTRVLAYIIALIIMLVATAFTTGLTTQSALLAVINAFVAAMTAMGAYELTFANVDKHI